jgi:hypothetical protein
MEEQIVITIGGISAAGLGAVAMKFLPALFSRKSSGGTYSIPPKEFVNTQAQVAENRLHISHLTDTCNRLAAMTEKQFDKIDNLGDKLDTTNAALMKLYGRVDQALLSKKP